MKKIIFGNNWLKILISICLLSLFFINTAIGESIPRQYTKLVADIDLRESTEQNRIPLILIHGFTGTDETKFNNINGTTQEEKEYFKEFLEYFYTASSLNNAYKIYRFHYLSNIINNSDIGNDLRLWIDNFTQAGQMNDSQIVIVAHSMGGLIARAFMEEQTLASGSYAGKKGGEKVNTLITLGTPHHGSPAANDTARDAGGVDWNGLLEIVDTIFWQGIGLDQPNRSDLKWDNYNNMNGLYPGYEAEKNVWLSNLNETSIYKNKIIAYYGGVYNESGQISTEYSLKDLWEQLMADSSLSFSGLFNVCEQSGILPGKNNYQYMFRGPYDQDKPYTFRLKLCFAGVLLKKIYNLNNDGLVSVDSGRLENLEPQKTVWFEGFDHWDLKSDREEDASKKMLTTIQQDLEGIASDITGYDLSDVINILKISSGVTVTLDNIMKIDFTKNNIVNIEDAVYLIKKIAE